MTIKGEAEMMGLGKGDIVNITLERVDSRE